jgi:predicted DNA-binding protein with PD1-like motif
MKSAELTLGRTFSVTFEHGKDFFSELKEFCVVEEYFMKTTADVVIIGGGVIGCAIA